MSGKTRPCPTCGKTGPNGLVEIPISRVILPEFECKTCWTRIMADYANERPIEDALLEALEEIYHKTGGWTDMKAISIHRVAMRAIAKAKGEE